jgi:gluconate 5-dehydrogenase
LIAEGKKRLFGLDGRVALVTGSTRGIGLAAAQALARQGACVAINGRNAEDVDRVVSEGRKDGLDFKASPFDVGDIKASQFALDQIIQEIGRIDILFANAGIQHREALLEFQLSDFERVVAFNLTAQWALAQHAARLMVAHGRGRIIFTGSITAVLGRERVSAYSAAKGALHAMVRQWSTELSSQGVTVNVIAPGYIQTELTQALWKDDSFDRWLRERTPAGRWGQPEDLAASVAFLASDEAGFVTGQTLVVDGGLSSTM